MFGTFSDSLPDGWGRLLKEVAKRALEMVGEKKKYNLLFDNCHCFTTYCLTGTKYPIGSFTLVEEILRSKFRFVKWRAISMS